MWYFPVVIMIILIILPYIESRRHIGMSSDSGAGDLGSKFNPTRAKIYFVVMFQNIPLDCKGDQSGVKCIFM